MPDFKFKAELPADADPGEPMVIAQAVGSLAHTGETWLEFPAPSFVPRPVLVVVGISEVNQVDGVHSLTLCLSKTNNTEMTALT